MVYSCQPTMLISGYRVCNLHPIPLPSSPIPLICDMSTGNPLPFVLINFLRFFLSSSPLNISSIYSSYSDAYHRLFYGQLRCPPIGSHMHSLQRPKVRRHTTTPLIQFNTYDSRFNTIHIDLVSPLPTYQSYSYLLTCIDWFTHWPEAIQFPIEAFVAH